MTDPGYYDTSYPPSLWQLTVMAAARAEGGDPFRTAAGSPPPGDADTDPAAAARLTVTAGQPGAYSPAVSPPQRPRNVTELRQRARPADPAPWAAGQYVQVGESGKRAHWAGDDWRGGESPGYVPQSSADTPDVEFPGAGDSPEDQTR